jgi:hypothetical protein
MTALTDVVFQWPSASGRTHLRNQPTGAGAEASPGWCSTDCADRRRGSLCVRPCFDSWLLALKLHAQPPAGMPSHYAIGSRKRTEREISFFWRNSLRSIGYGKT